MRFYGCLVLGLLALAAPAVQQEKPAEKKAEPRVLKVKLHYTGSGQVDSKHPIFLFLFDSPDFVQGNVMPIGAASASAKDETVIFSDVAQSPVYVVTAYDPQGNYDGQSGPPPTGSSMGMYFKTPGTPEPVKIEPGQSVQIELAFDDSVKMQ
ncbi:MAG: hypothetical protein ABSC08_03710 [Bryobacteraceae bacterium]